MFLKICYTSQVSSVPYQRIQSLTTLDGISEPKSLDFREALSMITEGSKFDTSIYMCLLQECIDNKSTLEAEIVHAHIIKTGTHQDMFVSTFLVNVYAKCRDLENARKVFDNLSERNVVSWTALMTGYAHNLQPELTIKVFKEMLEAGAYPTNYTLGIVLNASSSLQSTKIGEQIHAYIIKYHIDFDTSVGNSLCSFYSESGCLESAVKAFKKIGEKNVISWTSVISACSDNGEAAKGWGFFTEMLSDDVEPNEFTLTSVLSLCCVMLAMDLGAQIHVLSIKLGYESNLRVKNSIMYLYLKCGLIKEARKMFDENASLVTWNAMIAGHAQIMDFEGDDHLSAHQNGNEALNIFLKLKRLGMKPDLFTFSSMLTVCSRLVALEQGEQIHAQTIKTGFLSDVIVGTSLINMYNKCGNIEKTCKAFVEMSTRTLISWTSMIAAFAQHGMTKQALQLFEDMRLVGVRPNQITFVGVLSACGHSGLVNEALGYFEMMQKDYKIKPVMDHHTCLIDMYVRLGRLDQAFNIVKRMKFEPNESMWSILVAGCRNHGNFELGFHAAKQLLKLKPKDTETYVLLLNMYLQAERYKDVSRVINMMKEEKLGKLNDWSWINIKDKVHSFEPNDESHPRSVETYKFLEELIEQAKKQGYKPLESIEVTHNYDENMYYSTRYQSEKLAIAFGLLNTPKSAPVRVIKNIIMCRDCHNFVKIVSQMTGRQITLRDSKCLHNFVNGKCSCGDFSSLL